MDYLELEVVQVVLDYLQLRSYKSTSSWSSYGQSLDKEDRQRYEAKVVECGGVHPLLFTDDEISLISVSGHLVPKVEESDIKDYLVHATGYLTHEEFKAVKSLESHNYLTSGFVQEPKLRQVGEHVIVVTKVNHSQALFARQLEPWLLIQRDGLVKLAHCTCMAGLGEACSHIGAVLYYVKAVSKFNRGQASTDVKNIWLPAYIKNVPCAPLSSIDFASAKSKKRRLDTNSQPATKKVQLVDKPTDQEFASFLKEVSSAESRAAIFSLTEGYNDEFIPTTVRYSSAVLGGLSRDCPKERDAVIEECQNFSASFAV
ncbi:hypothetical protein HPB48_008922 [Haemaphysalis longicornis]|uniref:SWIM-type domain-containing protein n=1 Tax=Haemaphysalis longicornis TaxID=44386 RepID=A0A9J6FTD0_HAELO|nr:hypothetical protein HPB48_008922 [Haemaphysalis longicornis]